MGYCSIHKWYNGKRCPKCFPPDDCPSCAALRARVAQLEAAVEWACDELLRDENADPPSQYDTYAETAGDEAESFAVWLEAELYHRAAKEG